MVFHRFALVHTRVGYTSYEVLVWLTLHGKNLVACKVATTYGDDLSLEGGVGLYIQVFWVFWVFIPGRFACPGWEWVPSIAIDAFPWGAWRGDAAVDTHR